MRETILQQLTYLDSPAGRDGTTYRFTASRGESVDLTALDHDLIRVRVRPERTPRLDRTWVVTGPSGQTPLEGRHRDDLSPFPLPRVDVVATTDTFRLSTQALRVEVRLVDARITWSTRDRVRFAADLSHRAYTYDRAGRGIAHYLERRPDEHYYGFGERSGPLDKRGRRMEMRNLDALGYDAQASDPLYKHVPFYITFIPALGVAYGLLYDNLATTVFDMGQEIDAFWGPYRSMRAEDGDVDYTLIYGPSIEAVVAKYTFLTGRPALLPRWALGYLGSTMSYTEAPDAQERLARFPALCREHDIPCDLFHLSSGYTTDTAGRRNVFTWNRSRIPDPDAMVRSFHDAGIRLAANIKPHLLTTHPRFAELRDLGGFIRAGDEPDVAALCRFWSGGAFESGEGAYLDLTSHAGYDWWTRQIREALFAHGIDAVWNDNNEFEIWDDEAVCDGFGTPIRMSLARPLQTLLLARASYQASLEHDPGRRPFVLSRAGAPGIQRWVQTWSGDNTTSWQTLQYNIPMGLGSSLSGLAHTGHDVGGFTGPAPDPELFVRWVQCGILHPRFAIHSWNTDGTVNEPWMYPEVLPIIRDQLRGRYRLLPYLYTLMVEAHRTGHPIIRPLVYHAPDDVRCHAESFNFLLGPHLLVAPVLAPGARSRSVYLPAGRAWCEVHTGRWYDGGAEVEVAAPLERIPLFAADGAVIPLGGPMRYVGERPDDRRECHVFLRSSGPEARARDEVAWTLIEDDGVSLDHHSGGYTEVRVGVRRNGPGWRGFADVGHAGYPLPYDAIRLILHGPGPLIGGGEQDGVWTTTVAV